MPRNLGVGWILPSRIIADDDVTDFPKITRGLLARGYREPEIRKILGENFLRVLSQVTSR